MTTLIIDRAGLEIRDDGSALAFYEGGERRGTVPLKLLERVIFQGGGLHIESGAMLKLADAGISAMFMSLRVARRVAVVLGGHHNDAAVRLAQCRAVDDPARCLLWAAGLVTAKVRRQRGLLARAAASRADLRKPLGDAITSIEGILPKVAAATDIDSLRGLEGAAAAAYFGGFVTLFPDSANFTGRNRKPPKDPVNACLSLGYTLLHFDAVHAAHRAGLDPLLGLYHRPAFGRESLACDLVEPARPLLDDWIAELFRTRELRVEHFSSDQGACWMGKAARQKFYAGYEAFARPARRWLRLRCMALARQLRAAGIDSLADYEED